MGTVDDYLAGLDPEDRASIARIYAVATARLGGSSEVDQGTSYGMPALLFRGKPVLSVMRTRKHLGVYPFSGRVPDAVADSLEGLWHEKGTIRVLSGQELSEEAIAAIIDARRAEIEDPTIRRR